PDAAEAGVAAQVATGDDRGVDRVAGDVHPTDVVAGADVRLAHRSRLEPADRAARADEAAEHIAADGKRPADGAIRAEHPAEAAIDRDALRAEDRDRRRDHRARRRRRGAAEGAVDVELTHEHRA